MLTSSQVTRSAVIAATVMSLGASPAIARQADTPARSKPAVTIVAPNTRHWTQARVESMGVRPADSRATISPPASVHVIQPSDGSAGLQWLLIPLAAVMMAFVLIIAVARGAWHRFPGPHV
jgi:hypothetical protein